MRLKQCKLHLSDQSYILSCVVWHCVYVWVHIFRALGIKVDDLVPNVICRLSHLCAVLQGTWTLEIWRSGDSCFWGAQLRYSPLLPRAEWEDWGWRSTHCKWAQVHIPSLILIICGYYFMYRRQWTRRQPVIRQWELESMKNSSVTWYSLCHTLHD